MDIAVGKHCSFCRRLDFLPFECSRCTAVYCLDHRSPQAHQCPKGEGRQAVAPKDSESLQAGRLARQICREDGCANRISATGEAGCKPGVICPKCTRLFCLSHRLTHNCVLPISQERAAQQEKATNVLSKLRDSWATIKSKRASAKPKANSARIVETSRLKKLAKGNPSIPVDLRMYLKIEAEAVAESGKQPRGEYFYAKDWSVGKVLDRSTRDLAIRNVNNIKDTDAERLRVFHVEGGRVLSFGDKLKDCGVQQGDTLAIIRGLQTSALIDL